MGTRAAFFIGDPCDFENREYIGSFHWDGHAECVLEELGVVKSPEEFIDSLSKEIACRDDWCPATSGWPYPWKDDLFLTDMVYAFFNDKMWYTDGYHDWVELTEEAMIAHNKKEEEEYDEDAPYEGRLEKFQDVEAPGEMNVDFSAVMLLTSAK